MVIDTLILPYAVINVKQFTQVPHSLHIKMYSSI